MPNVARFTAAINQNAARIKSYVKGQDGSNGTSDCVGLIIGAMRLLGMKYSGVHGSNYFARHYTLDLHKVTKAADLVPGQVVYKAYKKGDPNYNLPARYDGDPDRLDYYHIGYVETVHPLLIVHCSTGGMHRDTTLGKWSYAGFIKGVDYDMNIVNPEPEEADKIGPAYVDVPNDGTVNVRTAPKGNAKIDMRLKEGTPVQILEFEGEWAKVEYRLTGYIMNKFLRN